MNENIQHELETVLHWAKSKLATGQEPPWAWYQYMKLIEAIQEISAGREAVTLLSEDSPESGQHQDIENLQEAEVVDLDTAQCRRDLSRKPRMPM